MAKWILDAYIDKGSTRVVLYDDESRILEDQEIKLLYHGYLAGGKPEILVSELTEIDGVVDAWIDEYRIPPFYESSMRIVVFQARSISVLRYVYGIAKRRGLRVVNTIPHPLVEALYQARIRPLTRIKSISRSSIVVDEWTPFDDDPDLEYVLLDLENGLFTAKTRHGVERFAWINDLAYYLASSRFHLGFIDQYLYTRLVEIEPRVRDTTRWVTSGSHSPHEYFEWSRLSYIPLSLMNNVTIGRILTTIEVLHARERKLLVDKSIGRREAWRTLSELLVYDRGGVVYQPKPGLYWNVCQVDFVSLYPSIMVKYNVSGETVNKPVCVNRLRLNWTPHTICIDEEGVVPASLRELLVLKDLYDDLYKKTNRVLYHDRKSAIKWILVASFGYLGYRNSLFGSVMAHEVVTSTSREVLRKARIAIEKEGYKVIHAIVDSLFIEGVETPGECLRLKNIIEDSTGFRAKLEAHFTWLYIPCSLRGDSAVANKYYGLLSDGSSKVKGILAIRRDTPLIVARAQLEALELLFKAKSPRELETRLIEAHGVIDKYIEKVRRGDIDLVELVVTRGGKSRGEYRKPPRYVLEDSPPYRLIYTLSGLTPIEKIGDSTIDYDKYIELLEKARYELPRLVS